VLADEPGQRLQGRRRQQRRGNVAAARRRADRDRQIRRIPGDRTGEAALGVHQHPGHPTAPEDASRPPHLPAVRARLRCYGDPRAKKCIKRCRLLRGQRAR